MGLCYSCGINAYRSGALQIGGQSHRCVLKLSTQGGGITTHFGDGNSPLKIAPPAETMGYLK